MKIETKTGRYGYLVLSGSELQRWNLKFLAYSDRKIVTFCETDFYCKKIVNYDNMFIVLAILQSAWTLKELKREIRSRAPNENMTDADFWRVHKSYRNELKRIKKASYHVGEAPDDFMDPEMRIEVSIMEAKLQWEQRWLKNWPNAGEKTRQKHIKKAEELQKEISLLERIYNRPDETDMWTDCKTTIEDFDLYNFES